MVKKIRDYFFILIILLLVLGNYFETTDTCKENTKMFLDKSSLLYYSPPCLMKNGYDNVYKIDEFAKKNGLIVYSISDLEKNKIYKRDEECFNRSGGYVTFHSLITEVFINLNLAFWHRSRWNEDGTWNW